MDMALVNVGRQHIGVLALQNLVGQPPPDLVGLLRRGLAGSKGLYQVVRQLVAFLDGLGKQHFKFYVRRFIGTAKGRYQHFVHGFLRVLNVVKGLFQR